MNNTKRHRNQRKHLTTVGRPKEAGRLPPNLRRANRSLLTDRATFHLAIDADFTITDILNRRLHSLKCWAGASHAQEARNKSFLPASRGHPRKTKPTKTPDRRRARKEVNTI